MVHEILLRTEGIRCVFPPGGSSREEGGKRRPIESKLAVGDRRRLKEGKGAALVTTRNGRVEGGASGKGGEVELLGELLGMFKRGRCRKERR